MGQAFLPAMIHFGGEECLPHGQAMRMTCTVKRLPGGWLARHESREAGIVEVRALTRKEAIEKIEGEIRYRLELCPCTGETYRHIEMQVVDLPQPSM